MNCTTWRTNTNTHVQLNKAEIKSPLAGIYLVMRKKGKQINYNYIYIITLAFSILTKFDIKFLENAWGFHRGVT